MDRVVKSLENLTDFFTITINQLEQNRMKTLE